MRAAIYTRYSTSKQTHNSTETQVNFCKQYCLLHNLDVLYILSDEETTGTNTNRKYYKQLLEITEQKLVDCVVVYDVTRGNRDVVDWFTFRKDMKRMGIEVKSATEDLGDIFDPNAFFNELIRVGMGQHSVLQTRQKSIEAKYTKANHAAFLGGFAPLGYDIVEQQYVINEREAEVVRRIFDLYVKGHTYDEIIADIQRYGVIGKRGRPIGKSTLNGLLNNPRYIGRYIWMENINREMHKWVGKKNDKAVIIEDAIPAIIDKETFALAQERLKNRQIKGRNSAKYKYLLSGLVYCGQCGSSMYGISTPSRQYVTHSYVCSEKRKSKTCHAQNYDAKSLEQIVKDAIRCWLINLNIDNTVNEIYKAYQSPLVDVSKEQKELDKINSKINNLIYMIEDGLFYSELKEEMQKLSDRKKTLQDEISQKQILNQRQNVTKEQIYKHIAKYVSQVSDDIIELAVETFVKAIVVNSWENIKIYIGYSSTPPQLRKPTFDKTALKEYNNSVTHGNQVVNDITSLHGEPI